MTEKYPLDQLVAIKQKRLEEAEKVLADKKKILTTEQEKLATLEKKRDEADRHYRSKLTQLREKLDEGTATDKITQMKYYLKIVAEELKAEQMKVDAQLKVVKVAEEQVEIARQELFKKQKDVEKLKIHHGEWEKEMKAVEQQKEGNETDEIGSTRHIMRKSKRKKDG